MKSVVGTERSLEQILVDRCFVRESQWNRQQIFAISRMPSPSEVDVVIHPQQIEIEQDTA